MQRANSLENFLMMGKIEVRRRRGQQRTRYLDGMADSMDMSFRKLQGVVRDREAWHASVYGITKTCTWLSNLSNNNILCFSWFNIQNHHQRWGNWSRKRMKDLGLDNKTSYPIPLPSPLQDSFKLKYCTDPFEREKVFVWIPERNTKVKCCQFDFPMVICIG